MSAQRPLEYAVTVTGTSLIEWGGGKQFGVVVPFDATQLFAQARDGVVRDIERRVGDDDDR